MQHISVNWYQVVEQLQAIVSTVNITGIIGTTTEFEYCVRTADTGIPESSPVSVKVNE